MTLIEAAILEVVGFLEELHFSYMIIGGVAVALWGEPRATLDVDIVLWVESNDLDEAIAALAQRVQFRTNDPHEFLRTSGLIPAMASNGVALDLLFARWPLERQAIGQAAFRQVAGREVRVASIEYLLFLKLLSDRAKDFEDARALLRRHRGVVDLTWIEEQLRDLSEALAQPEILARFLSLR
jgi:hypothetical protein